jgi:hypothetical protein
MTPDVQHNSMAQPASRGRLWNFFLRAVGVVVALGGGIALWYAIAAANQYARPGALVPVWVDILALLIFTAWAALAGGLLRSWWALLIVPVAYYAGALLAESGFDPAHLFSQGFLRGILSGWGILFLAIPPAAIGAAIGATLGWRIETRRQR